MTILRTNSNFIGSIAMVSMLVAANLAAAQTPASAPAADDQSKTAAPVSQKLDCADLKTKIDAKLDAKGVKGYQLDIIDADATTDGKVVGTCDGGKHKISYSRASK